MHPMDTILEAIAAGHFEIRPDGTIWRLKQRDGWGKARSVKPRRAELKMRNGYLGIKMDVNRKQCWAYAHRLIWTILRGPIQEGLQINHIDGDKTNNLPSNLELVTPSANTQHAYDMGLKVRPPGIPAPKLHLVKDSAKALRATGMPYSAIAKELGVSQTLAFRAVRSE